MTKFASSPRLGSSHTHPAGQAESTLSFRGSAAWSPSGVYGQESVSSNDLKTSLSVSTNTASSQFEVFSKIFFHSFLLLVTEIKAATYCNTKDRARYTGDIVTLMTGCSEDLVNYWCLQTVQQDRTQQM